MTSIEAAFPPPPGLKRGRLSRLLLPFATLVVIVLVMVGLRAGMSAYQSYQTQRAQAAALQNSHLPMPESPQIEQAWGIRVTLVQLLADGGLVEIRYEVLDTNLANRLHADSSIDSIPWLLLEGSDKQIKSTSLMFHYHHGDKGTEGRTYSIVYGNAGGILTRGSLVTVRMADGLSLQHVPVAG